MDYNDPSGRQYARNPYTGQQPRRGTVQGTGQHSSTEQFGQSPYPRPSSSNVHPGGRAGSDSQIYGLTQGSQYGANAPVSTPTMQYGLGMQITASQPQQGAQPYDSNVMYAVAQPQTQHASPSYQQPSPYRQRPSTATPQFGPYGISPSGQYPLTGQNISTSAGTFDLATATPVPSQYQQHAYGQASPTSAQPYGGTMMDTSPATATFPTFANQQQSQPASSTSSFSVPTSSRASQVDQAFLTYQTQIRTIFTNARDGTLRSSGALLSTISRYLLGNAEGLGLTRDDQSLHADRLRLWTEFSNAWLVTLQRQYDLTRAMRRGQHALREPQSILSVQVLKSLIDELVMLCDGIESHGLVDYEVGVKEDEIVELAKKCLRLLSSEGAASAGAQAESSSSAGRRGR